MLFAMTLGLQSCSDGDSKTATASTLEIYKDDAIVDALNFQIPANSAMIGVNCNADWTAEVSDPEWITISNHAGYGYEDKFSYIKVSVTKNSEDSRTGTITIKSGALSKVLTVNQSGAGLDPNDPFESSYEFVENLVLGYNLGNTLDADPGNSEWWTSGAPHTPIEYETSWGQPETTQEIINAIVEKGFNVIRVPVTWTHHIDDNGNVDSDWMNRVEEVVNMVLNSGAYCILNIQHDADDADDAWINANAESYSANSTKFKNLWTNIANRFKDKDGKLLFEAFNEILDTSQSNYWNDVADETAYEYVNKWEQDFVDAVRATGGNNEYRNLIVNPYSAGNSDAKLAGVKVPTDIHPNHIIGSVHSYDPYNFCNDNNQADKGGSDYNIYVFDDACKTEVSAVVSRVCKRYETLGIPVVFGEFGAIDESKDMGERVKYAKYMAELFKANGTTGLWWMGLYDRSTANWYESEIVDALLGVLGN